MDLRKIAVAAGLCSVLGAHDSHAADARIAVVDVQGAVMATEDGIRAQASLKKAFDQRQHQLDRQQDELSKARGDIERQSRVLSRESLQRRMEAWQREMLELQTVFLDYNKQMQKRQTELTKPIIQKIVVIIARVAKQKGYEAVLDKQAVPYIRPDLDLTERVIQMYNSGDFGGGDAAKP